MKLRIRFNSVRLRLTKTEVSTLECHGECAELIKFPGGASLAYSLHASESPAVHAEFEQGTVKIEVPRQDVVKWYSTDAVGIYATVDASMRNFARLYRKGLPVSGLVHTRGPVRHVRQSVHG